MKFWQLFQTLLFLGWISDHFSFIGGGKCVEQRRQTLELKGTSKGGSYIPDCKDDGTFEEVQCHAGTGYCWCVTADGKPIPGSSVKGQQIRCKSLKGNTLWLPVWSDLKSYRKFLVVRQLRDRSEFMTWGVEVFTRTAGHKLVPPLKTSAGFQYPPPQKKC